MRLMRKYGIKTTYENVSGTLHDVLLYPEEYDFLRDLKFRIINYGL